MAAGAPTGKTRAPAQCSRSPFRNADGSALPRSGAGVRRATPDRCPMNDHPSAPAVQLPQTVEANIRRAILRRLALDLGKDAARATARDWYQAAALALRDHVTERWLQSRRASRDDGCKRVCYLSLE